MATFRPAPSLLVASALALAGCPAGAGQGPPLPVVDRTSPGPGLQPSREAPDEALVALARVGVEAANGLGPALRAFAPVLDAMRAARAKHPPTGYRLAQVEGWRFLGGAWIQASADDARRLRASIEDLQGATPGWDVTDEANYAPGFHPAFPAGAVRLRLEVDQALPGGGRIAVAFAGPLGADGEAVDLAGVGSVAALGPAGAVAVEALNAKLTATGTVDRGDLVLKSLSTGSTLQFSGTWSNAGLLGATLLRSATPAGTLVQAGGRWEIRNEAGTYPL